MRILNSVKRSRKSIDSVRTKQFCRTATQQRGAKVNFLVTAPAGQFMGSLHTRVNIEKNITTKQRIGRFNNETNGVNCLSKDLAEYIFTRPGNKKIQIWAWWCPSVQTWILINQVDTLPIVYVYVPCSGFVIKLISGLFGHSAGWWDTPITAESSYLLDTPTRKKVQNRLFSLSVNKQWKSEDSATTLEYKGFYLFRQDRGEGEQKQNFCTECDLWFIRKEDCGPAYKHKKESQQKPLPTSVYVINILLFQVKISYK